VAGVVDAILDIPHASCRYPRVEILNITSPGDKIIVNVSSNPLVQDFIYFINGPICYLYGGQFLPIKLAVYRRAV